MVQGGLAKSVQQRIGQSALYMLHGLHNKPFEQAIVRNEACEMRMR